MKCILAIYSVCCTLLVSNLYLLLTNATLTESAISCFVCSSVNGSEPDCEDTFNNTGRFYKTLCMSGKQGHEGIFPASSCIKLKATNPATGFSLIVRDCAVDNGGINSETEIGRESHCSLINLVKYNGEELQGCSLACHTDGCNASARMCIALLPVVACLVFATVAASVFAA